MNIYDFTVKDAERKDVKLSDYKGKVLLVVNTATHCGLTPQLEPLQALYEKYQAQGFEILSFPCNQFLSQAPGSNEEIRNFCELNYGTTFKTFDKIEVNGKNTAPLYKYLKETKPLDQEDESTPGFLQLLKDLGQAVLGSEIKWNFTKFLIDREGNLIARYSPTIKPDAIDGRVKELLG